MPHYGRLNSLNSEINQNSIIPKIIECIYTKIKAIMIHQRRGASPIFNSFPK